MNWSRERDLLISQTMAFVQSIGAPKPEADVRSSRPQAPLIAKTNPISNIDSKNRETEPAERPAAVAPMTRLSLMPPGALREEVQGRVAAFRAHQQQFLRERDAYFHAVLDKARASTGISRKPSGN
jgi:hypothetical protein